MNYINESLHFFVDLAHVTGAHTADWAASRLDEDSHWGGEVAE